MAYFEWADDLVIDNGPIDADHKRLVDLVNKLHTSTSQGCGHEVVEAIMDDLIAYTKDHLTREEHIMETAGFPDLEHHKSGHVKLVESLRDLRRKYESGSITVAARLSTVLRDWLSLHIRRSDKELLAFLRKTRKNRA